jgi:hypothetical protein
MSFKFTKTKRFWGRLTGIVEAETGGGDTAAEKLK